MRRLLAIPLILTLVVAAIAGYAIAEARRDPIVRRANVALPDWPAGARPVRVALLSDLHVGTASTSIARLARVVVQVNAAQPDLVLIAGDFLPGHRATTPAAAARLLLPLADLRAPLGVVATPGNHDHWTVRDLGAALRPLNIVTLVNQAVTRGPLAIGGLDDAYTRHDRPAALLTALGATPGARVVVTHTPDAAPEFPSAISLVLAGHTHCGQVVLPLIGPVERVWRARRYDCGLVREGRRTVVVGAGIGTSVGSFRLGAPPDWWLLTLGPAAARVSPPRP